MAANTKISWATHTMNFWVGCEKIGPACNHCYAEAWAARAGTPGLWNGERRRTKTWGDPPKWNKAAMRAGDRPSVFANSLADFFDNHGAIPPWRADAWAVIGSCQALATPIPYRGLQAMFSVPDELLPFGGRDPFA